MPSVHKRINLTVPDEIYERLQAYKIDNGLASDATACLHLVVKQLKAEEEGKALTALMKSLTPEQLKGLANTGMDVMMAEIGKQKG